MCKNCGVKSCSSCNQPKFIPAYTSALSYDGPGFVCSGKSDVNFEARTCTPLNQTLDLMFQAICEKNGANLFKEETFEITQADILGLAATPKLLLPASVTHGYDIHSAVLIGRQVTTDYTFTGVTADYTMALKSVGPTTPFPGEQTHSTGNFLEIINAIIGTGVTQAGTKMLYSPINTSITANDQTAIYLSMVSPGDVFTLGDHTLSLTITYREVAL